MVRCSCGAEPHAVYDYNLRKGKSTRCNACAKKAAGHWRKDYWKYAGIVPDDEHRARLLNRISACLNRCTNPKSRQWATYGGRGITVCDEWRADRGKFLAYLVTLEGWDNPALELDRADNDKGYQPGNLRFITKQANNANRRTVLELQRRIDELEARLRHCTCRATQSIHDLV